MAGVCGLSLSGFAGLSPAREMNISCESRVLSGRGLSDWPINYRDESYRL